MNITDTSPPRAQIELHLVGAARGITITVVGTITESDAPALSRHLHAALDAGPAVMVVNLSGAPHCEPAGLDVLTAARDRAHTIGVALHLLHLGEPDARAWLAAAGWDTERVSLQQSCQPARSRTRRRRPRGATCAPR